jgi:hypothetical protein
VTKRGQRGDHSAGQRTDGRLADYPDIFPAADIRCLDLCSRGRGHRPIAFFSRKLSDPETRYTVQEVEMLAVVSALSKWEHSPFFACSGRNPRVISDFVAPAVATGVSVGVDILEKIKVVNRLVRDNLVSAQDDQTDVANRSRREVIFKVGDKVVLDTDHAIPHTVVAEKAKLRERYSGPYVIKSVVDNYVELVMPDTLVTHPRVNISKVKLFVEPLVKDLEPPAEPDGSYEVERLLRKRQWGRAKRVQYLVRWKGYDATHDSWLFEEDLDNAAELVKEYESLNSD